MYMPILKCLPKMQAIVMYASKFRTQITKWYQESCVNKPYHHKREGYSHSTDNYTQRFVLAVSVLDVKGSSLVTK